MYSSRSAAEDGYLFLITNVREALAQGAFRHGLEDPEMIAQIFWASVHGIATIHLSKAELTDHPWIDLKNADETARLMSDVVLRGLLREQSPG